MASRCRHCRLAGKHRGRSSSSCREQENPLHTSESAWQLVKENIISFSGLGVPISFFILDTVPLLPVGQTHLLILPQDPVGTAQDALKTSRSLIS